jgi:ketosteroid isomerase-like protein
VSAPGSKIVGKDRCKKFGWGLSAQGRQGARGGNHMKKLRLTLIGLGVATAIQVQATPSAAQDKEAILAKLESVEKAWHDLDAVAAIAPYVQNDRLVVFDAPPPLQVIGVKASLKSAADVMAAVAGPVAVRYSNIHVTVDHSHAYGYYFVGMVLTFKDGKTTNVMFRVTDIWERQKDGNWLIVHEHNSVPVDFETGKPYLVPARQ